MCSDMSDCVYEFMYVCCNLNRDLNCESTLLENEYFMTAKI